MRSIFEDWHANTCNSVARLVLVWFRAVQTICHTPLPFFLLGSPELVAYSVMVEWVFGIKLPWHTQADPGIKLFHVMGLAVNDQAVIGSNAVLRHDTTISVKEKLPLGTGVASPIGNDVDIGARVAILGPTTVGNGARVGAESIVVDTVTAESTVVSNPTRILHTKVATETNRE